MDDTRTIHQSARLFCAASRYDDIAIAAARVEVQAIVLLRKSGACIVPDWLGRARSDLILKCIANDALIALAFQRKRTNLRGIHAALHIGQGRRVAKLIGSPEAALDGTRFILVGWHDQQVHCMDCATILSRRC